MIERRLSDLWGQLQGKKPHLPHFLAEIHLEGIRGIDELRIVFDYPVTVVAGGNASGKSTVLFRRSLRLQGAGSGGPGLRPVHSLPGLPAQGRGAGG